MKKPKTLVQQLAPPTTEEKLAIWADAIHGCRAGAAAFVAAMKTLQEVTDDLEDNFMKLDGLADLEPLKKEYAKLARQIEVTQRQRRAIEVGMIKFQTDHLMDDLWRRLP
jgi:hypothetical protein